MTTKLKFIESACVTFNCTYNVVLGALSGRVSMHPELAKQIKALAEKSCSATNEEWKTFAAAFNEVNSVANKFMHSLTTGSEINL